MTYFIKYYHYITTSLLLHFCVILLMIPNRKQKEQLIASRFPSNPLISLKVIDKPPVSKKIVLKNKDKSSLKTKQKTSQPSAAVSANMNSAGPKTWNLSLDDSSFQLMNSPHPSSDRKKSHPFSGGRNYVLEKFGSIKGSKIEAKVQFISSGLDIPYALREEHSGFSVAIFKKNANSWILEQLYGEPYLRALLYESLRNEKNKAAINNLFLLMDLSTLRVRLDLKKKTMLTSGKREIHHRRTYIKNNTIYIKQYFDPETFYIQSLEKRLPDELIIKAKKWDRLYSRQLKSSPAFKRSLRNIKEAAITSS